MKMQTAQEMTALARRFITREELLTETLNAGKVNDPKLLQEHNNDLRELAIIALNLIRQIQFTATLSIPLDNPL